MRRNDAHCVGIAVWHAVCSKGLPMNPMRHPAALMFAASFLVGYSAWGQSVVIQETGIKRLRPEREGDQKWWVSHADCVADDIFTFPVDLTSFVNLSLEVWAGSDCTNKAKREGDQADCWKLYDSFPSKSTVEVKIRAQDIVAKVKPGGPNSGTAADCERTDVPDAGEAVTLHFMLLDSSNELGASTADTFGSGFDLLGPPAPKGISVGIGEAQLVVSWDAPSASDLAGYRLYCDPGEGPPESGTSGEDAASDAPADGAADSAGNPDCPSTALIPGAIPNGDYQCGSTSNTIATKATATGLTNGVAYAVAVAAIDRLGNSGRLSSVACGVPQPVDDFYELYRRAGGKGGGGFCAIRAYPNHTLLALAGVAVGAWLLRRRKRRT